MKTDSRQTTETATTEELNSFSDEAKKRLQDGDVELNTIEDERKLLDKISSMLKSTGESVARLKAQGEEFIEDVSATINGVTARASETGSEIGKRAVQFSGRLALCAALLTGASATDGQAKDLTAAGGISDASVSTGPGVEKEACEALADAADIPDTLGEFHCTDGTNEDGNLGYFSGLSSTIYIYKFGEQSARELLDTALHEKKHHFQYQNGDLGDLADWAYANYTKSHDSRQHEIEAQQYADEQIKHVDVDAFETALQTGSSEVADDDVQTTAGAETAHEDQQTTGAESNKHKQNDQEQSDTSLNNDSWVTIGDGVFENSVQYDRLQGGRTVELDEEYLVLGSPEAIKSSADRTYPRSSEPFRTIEVEGAGQTQYVPAVERDRVRATPEVDVNEDGKIVTQFQYDDEPIQTSWEAVMENDRYGIVMGDGELVGLYDYEAGGVIVDRDWIK